MKDELNMIAVYEKLKGQQSFKSSSSGGGMNAYI